MHAVSNDVLYYGFGCCYLKEYAEEKYSDEEYEKLFVKHDVSDMDIEVKFKLAEWLENTLFNLFE